MESNSAQQTGKKATTEERRAKARDEAELPIETSPYLNYDGVEGYKRKGYGTEGHQEPVQRNAAASTDAPTLTAAAPTSTQP